MAGVETLIGALLVDEGESVDIGAAVRAACPAHCNFRGYCSAPDAALSTSFCICQPGVTGAACEQIHCPRGDDPLTQNQVSRAIALTVTAPTGGEADGRLRFGFLGESVLLPAVLAQATGTVGATLFQVPNQPLVFSDD